MDDYGLYSSKGDTPWIVMGFGVLAAAIFGICTFTGNQERDRSKTFNQQPVYAEVLEEKYTSPLENATRDTPTIFGTGSRSRYILKVRTNEGKIIGLSIFDGSTHTKESLDAIISAGSRISFPPGNVTYDRKLEGWKDPHETIFDETNMTLETSVVTKRADRITVY